MEEYLKTVLPPTVFFALVVAFLVFKYYNQVKIILGDICHILGCGGKFLGKQASAYRLEGNIGKAVNKITDNRSILPYGLEVEWEKGNDRESFLRNKKVVVVLNKQETPERQFVRTVMEFVREGLIPASKVRLSKMITDAADTKVAQSIVAQKDISAVKYFENEFLIPFFNHEERKRLLYDKLKRIESSCMLYQLLLNEYEEVSNELLSDGPNEVLITESSYFLDYVYRIAAKQRGEDVPLFFNGQYFKVAVILATREDNGVLHETPLGNYIDHIQSHINAGANKIYIYALGRKIDRAKEIAELATQVDGRILVANYQRYVRSTDYGHIEGICIELNASRLGH